MRYNLLFSAIAVITLLSSCSTYRYIYSASPPNNPYFTKKRESKLTAYYSAAGSTAPSANKETADGLDLHGAYAISDHWALTAAYYNRREKDIYEYSRDNTPFNSSLVKYKRNLFETGGGYFVPLNQKKTFTFNLYGGVAFGKFSIDDNGMNNGQDYRRYHKAAITKWFFQPSINFMPGRYVRLSFVVKSSYVHYGNIRTSYSAEELQDLSLAIITNRTLNFIEPAWNFQFGLPEYPWIKVDWTLSGITIQPASTQNIRANNVSIGLSVDFSKMRK
jgi:hypothetical protein